MRALAYELGVAPDALDGHSGRAEPVQEDEESHVFLGVTPVPALVAGHGREKARSFVVAQRMDGQARVLRNLLDR